MTNLTSRLFQKPVVPPFLILLLVHLSLSPIDALIQSNGTCSIFSLIPFSLPTSAYDDNGNLNSNLYATGDVIYAAQAGYDYLAAANLAVQHFNDRNPAIVPELALLGRATDASNPCDVVLSLQVADSRSDSDVSVLSTISAISGQLHPTDEQQRQQQQQQQQQHQGNLQQNIPCAILGPSGEPAIDAVSSIASGLGIPQLLYQTVSDVLTASSKRATVGTAWTLQGMAQAMLSYVQSQLKRDYLVMLTSADLPWAVNLEQQIRSEADLFNVTLIQFELSSTFITASTGSNDSDSSASSSSNAQQPPFFDMVQQSGVRTIFLNLNSIGNGAVSTLQQVAAQLDQRGMLTKEYVYILSPQMVPVNRVTAMFGQQHVDQGSSLDRLLSGAMMIDLIEESQRVTNNTSDPFLMAWREQNADVVEQLNQLAPINASILDPPSNYFQIHDPTYMASYLYDAVITIGLGACGVNQSSFRPAPSSNSTKLDDGQISRANMTQPPNRRKMVAGRESRQASMASMDKPITTSSNVSVPGAGIRFHQSRQRLFPFDLQTLATSNCRTTNKDMAGDLYNSWDRKQNQAPNSENIVQPPRMAGDAGGHEHFHPGSHHDTVHNHANVKVSSLIRRRNRSNPGQNAQRDWREPVHQSSRRELQQTLTALSESEPNIGHRVVEDPLLNLHGRDAKGQQTLHLPHSKDDMETDQPGTKRQLFIDSTFQQQETSILQYLNPLVSSILQANFTGATGRVSFATGEKVRDTAGLLAGVYNIRPSSNVRQRRAQTSATSGTQTYVAIVTSIWNEATGWSPNGNEVFLYRDGTNTTPAISQEVQDANYLPQWARAVGFTLMGIVWLLDMTFMILLYNLQNDAAVTRSQPFFLHLLCVGSMIISAAIFTLSWDENEGVSDSFLDSACMATMWFFFIGTIISFASLATKLYRLDKVLQFRRGNKVTVSNVVAPLALLLSVTICILIVWTVVDPWTWSRQLISVAPSVTYGQCECQWFWAFFGPLMGLVIIAEVVTAYFALKTSNVPEDFRETSSVFYAIVTNLQAWLIGVPILAVLGNSSVSATYFGRVLLIWIFSLSSVSVVVGPPILRAIRLRRNPDLRNDSRVRVSGLTRGSDSQTPSFKMSESFVASTHPENSTILRPLDERLYSDQPSNKWQATPQDDFCRIEV